MKIILWIVCILIVTLNNVCDYSKASDNLQKDSFVLRTLFDTTGPLTSEEIHHFIANMKTLSNEQSECMVREAESRAKNAGDPEELNPFTVNLLPVDEWSNLNRVGKRIVLTQVIINQAIITCLMGNI